VNNISIRKMRILLATAEEGSFTKAALRENVSQPAATIIVNEIEETLKKELFVRHGSIRKAELTPMGKIVAETFSRIVAGYDMELARINSGRKNRKSEKRIFVQSVFLDAIRPDWLFALADVIPGERLVLEEASRELVIERVMAREADVGFVEGTVDNKRCDLRNLFAGSLGLAVPEGFDIVSDESGAIGWNAVPEECYVFSGVSDATLQAVNRSLGAVGKSMEDMHVLGGLSAMRAAVQARPLPIILPDVLAWHLEQMQKFKFHAFSPTSVQCQFSIIAPWGYMNQINLNALRGRRLFERDVETRQSGE
jgi:DNA-binding transcriptional LysR family regulator